jgi:periplasmic protein TonB
MTPGFRLALSALPAAVVTLALMGFMQFLIAERPGGGDTSSTVGIHFGSVELPKTKPLPDRTKPPDRNEITQPPGFDSIGDGRVVVPVSPYPPTPVDVPPFEVPPFARVAPRSGLPGDADLVVISQPQPNYPMEAAMRGIEGWVEVEFLVRIDGSTAEIRVIDAAPRGVFDQTAIAAVLRWRFRAPVIEGAPQPIRTQQRITFVLTD